jgi:hypothetical protein
MEEYSDTVHTHIRGMYSTYAAGKRSTRWQDSGSLPSPGSADLLLFALITHRSRHSSPLPGRAVRRRPSPCPFPAPLPTPTSSSPGRTVSISDRLAQAQIESHSLRPRGKRTVQYEVCTTVRGTPERPATEEDGPERWLPGSFRSQQITRGTYLKGANRSTPISVLAEQRTSRRPPASGMRGTGKDGESLRHSYRTWPLGSCAGHWKRVALVQGVRAISPWNQWSSTASGGTECAILPKWGQMIVRRPGMW